MQWLRSLVAKRSKRADYLIRLAFSAAVLAGLFALAGNDGLGDTFSKLSFGAVLLGTLVHVAGSIVIPAIVTQRSLRVPDRVGVGDSGSGVGVSVGKGGEPLRPSAIKLRLVDLILINFTVRFYTMVLPSASATGMRWLKYQRAGGKADAAALVLLEKVVQILVYSLITVVLALAETPAVGGRMGFVLAVTGLATLIAGVALAAFFTSKLDPLLSRFDRAFQIPKIGDKVERLAASVVNYRGHSFRTVAVLMAWSAAGYVFFVLSAWIIVLDMGLDLPLLGLAWIRGIVFLATSLPLTVAGIGVREAGIVGFSSLYGIDRPTALGFALSLLLLQVLIGSVGALIELFGLASKSADPSDAAAQQSTVEENQHGKNR